MIDTPPQIAPSTAISFIEAEYGLRITSSDPLVSERDQNMRLTADDGRQFVLKIANAAEKRANLEAQQEAMQTITAVESLCPTVIPTQAGQFLTELTTEQGVTHFVWLISYLDGVPLGDVKRHSSALLRDLGGKLGRLDAIMADFDHPATHVTFHWDLAHALDVIEKYRKYVSDPEQLALIDHFLADFEAYARPLIPTLRQSVIHNDANDYNVIVGGGEDLYSRNQTLLGFIDFGDFVYSQTINNLAIAIAYTLLDKPDLLGTMREITASYHTEFPLTEDELTALFGLINLRLCVSVCLAAYQIAQRPDNEYLNISQAPIRRTLPRLAQLPYRLTTAALRHTCGFEAAPNSTHVAEWLRQNHESFAPVLTQDLRSASTMTLDLSVGSPLIPSDPAEITEPTLTARIFDLMAAQGAEIGIGRYDEPRLLYATDLFANGLSLTDERRTIHLGIDLYAPAETPVYAPIAGTVHLCTINDGLLDYGGLIILRHETDQQVPFYTLYGHLSHAVFRRHQPGDVLAAGDLIGRMGRPAENGNWPPHLHFQVLTDLLGMDAAIYGVGRASLRAMWREVSPDPNLILDIPSERLPEIRSQAETLALRRERIGRNLSIGYREHLKIVRGWRQYLYDDTGKRYLDAYNNVPHIGHSHPRVVEAMAQQAAVLNTNTRYLHDHLTDFAEKLLATLPDSLSVCYFVNSGSEANELALRLARAHTGSIETIVQEGAYHGHSTTLIDISPYKHDGPGGLGAPNWVHTVPVADTYRGPYKADDPQAAEKYAAHVAEVAQRLTSDGSGLAAFIAESCPSVGGQIIHPDGYLRMAYEHVRAAGGVCIADEVQTGYGRIGTHFYAFEAQEVEPDIVVLGKPIGNGFPLAAVVTTAEIAASFDNGMEFFSTFGGSTVSCAVGMAVLETVIEENLQGNALEVGNVLLDGLKPLKDKHSLIGDVRGSGLFLGIELVHDRETLAPAAAEASYISNRLREKHILVGTDGPLHNVVKIRPPMVFTQENAQQLIAAISGIFEEL